MPEAGDEIQTMKAGVMEIADIFVVNKADRPGANTFVKNLQLMLAPAFSNRTTKIEVIKTIASNNEGIESVFAAIEKIIAENKLNDRKVWLLTEKVFYLLQKERMKAISKLYLKNEIQKESNNFNTYRFVKKIEKLLLHNFI